MLRGLAPKAGVNGCEAHAGLVGYAGQLMAHRAKLGLGRQQHRLCDKWLAP